jgi:hypothetical protein
VLTFIAFLDVCPNHDGDVRSRSCKYGLDQENELEGKSDPSRAQVTDESTREERLQ